MSHRVAMTYHSVVMIAAAVLYSSSKASPSVLSSECVYTEWPTLSVVSEFCTTHLHVSKVCGTKLNLYGTKAEAGTVHHGTDAFFSKIN